MNKNENKTQKLQRDIGFDKCNSRFHQTKDSR